MNYGQIYTINWGTLVQWLIPTFLRKPIHYDWLMALAQPVATLHEQFLLFREKSNYKLGHNSQVCSIESMLNDQFDPADRRIKINNGVVREPVWFWEQEENQPVWFYEDNPAVYFYEPDYLAEELADFTVIVPAGLLTGNATADTQMERLMRSFIDYYKLYSKNYTIKYE